MLPKNKHSIIIAIISINVQSIHVPIIIDTLQYNNIMPSLFLVSTYSMKVYICIKSMAKCYTLMKRGSQAELYNSIPLMCAYNDC